MNEDWEDAMWFFFCFVFMTAFIFLVLHLD